MPANQTEFYERAGFYITSSDYILRPEVLESFYYAYRATGDRKYRDVCFPALLKHSISRMRNQDANTPLPVVFRRVRGHRQRNPRRQRLQLHHQRECS